MKDCTSFLREGLTPERLKEVIDVPDVYTGNLYPEADSYTFIEDGVVWGYDEGHIYRSSISQNTLFYYPISLEQMRDFAASHPNAIQQFDVYSELNKSFQSDGAGHFLAVDDFATIDLSPENWLGSLNSKQRASVIKATKFSTLVSEEVHVDECRPTFDAYHELNLVALDAFKAEHGGVTQDNDLLWADECYSQPYWHWFFTNADVLNPVNVVCLRTSRLTEHGSEVLSYCLGIVVDKVFHSIIIANVDPASLMTKALTYSQIQWAKGKGFRYYDMYALDYDTKTPRCAYKKDFVNTRITSRIQCNTEHLPSWVTKRGIGTLSSS